MNGSIHASAVLIGARAALVRGPAGAGKSKLVMALIDAARAGLLPFARLVADDRVIIQAVHGRLLLRPAPALVGLIETRGIGIIKVPHEPVAQAGWVIDLASDHGTRLPEPASRTVEIAGVRLPRLGVGPGLDPLSASLALLRGGAHLAIEAGAA